MKHLVLILSILFTVALGQSGLNIYQGEGAALEPNQFTILYQEDFAPEKQIEDILFGWLSVGQEETWNKELKDGRFALSNSTDTSSIRYYWFSDFPEIDTASQKAVSIEITADFGKDFSAAGLIFRFDTETDDYYAFTIENGTWYAFYKSDADGFNEIIAAETNIVKAGSNILTIVPNGTEMKLYINNSFVASVGTTDIMGIGVGILAGGTGSFSFDNFSLYEPEPVTNEPEPVIIQETTNEALIRYENKAFNYVIDYPETWEPISNEASDQVSFEKNDFTRMGVFTHELRPDESLLTIEELAKFFIPDGAELGPVKDVIIAAKPATEYKFSAWNSEKEVQMLGMATIMRLENPSRVYIFVYGLKEAEKSLYLPIFEKMLASFSFTTAQSGKTGFEEEQATEAQTAIDFSGSFANESLKMALVSQDTGYVGEIVFKELSFPFTAQNEQGKLVGKFENDGNYFDFVASLENNILTLTTGEFVYKMQKQVVNPVD